MLKGSFLAWMFPNPVPIVTEPQKEPEDPGHLENIPNGPKNLSVESELREIWFALKPEWESPSCSYSLQSLKPCGSDPKSALRELLKNGGGYTVKIHKGIKRKDLYRFLLSKLFYEEEGLHLDDYLVLWELHLNLNQLLEKDPNFREKYQKAFKALDIFFGILGNETSFPIQLDVQNPRMLDFIKMMDPFIPSKNAYYGLKNQKNLKLYYRLVFQNTLRVQKLPPKAYMGVGYKDQGTKRKEEDGNPHWSDVHRHFQELEIRHEEEFQGQERENPEFDWNRVWYSDNSVPDERGTKSVNNMKDRNFLKRISESLD